MDTNKESADGPILRDEQISTLNDQGFLRVDHVLSLDEVGRYIQLYVAFLNGDIQSGHLRGDLGGHVEEEAPEELESKRITQIMWPSAKVPVLLDAPLQRFRFRHGRPPGGAPRPGLRAMGLSVPRHQSTRLADAFADHAPQ